MEQQDNGAEVVASPPAGAAKSKLDTLSKEDLIKFAKKQMAAMQKMKTKCADLEKEVGTLKTQSNSSSDESIIQELTERMSAVLLEKAETQQSLVLMRKDNEKAKQQANDALEKLATLQGELDQAKGEHQKKIDALEEAMEICKANHKEEVDHFQRLLWEKEESDREKESEREKEREQVDTNRNVEAIQFSLESQLLSLQKELDEAREQSSRKTAALQEDHQRVLTEAQQEVENLREELAQKSLQHEEELRALEEDSEVERERLLLLHEELTEQLALKDSFLQDVQEEEEEPGRGSGIAKMLELSGCSHSDISDGDTETGRFRGALDDLQSQNTMLQDELTFLGNVKIELEAELERVREEFQMEKEELEFKIDELQMTRESISPDSLTVNSDQHEQEAPTLTVLQESGPQKDQGDGQPDPDKQTLTLEDQQRLILELEEMRAQCEALTMERSSAVTEYEHTRDILRGLEAELGQRTGDFVKQYEAMKEQGASAAQELQERVRGLSEEKDGLLERVKGVSEERDSLQERVQGLEQRLEDSLGQTQAVEGLQQQLQASVEEKTTLAVELKASVEDLGRQNGEILSQLQLKESAVQELEEMLTTVTTESERVQSLLELREMEVKRLREEREKEVERQKEESSQEHVKTTSLEQTLSGLSREKEDLQRNLEEMSAALTKVAVLEGMLEQGAAEKQQQESRLKILAEDMAALQSKEEQAQVTIRTLQEQSEALGSPTEEVQELQAHVEELEQERSMLRSSLEEAQRERRSGEEQEELQSCIVELEKERAMLKSNLEEVVSDTEALQRDLGEMRLANEKMRGENQELLAQISQASETLAVKEMEEEHMERAKEETDMEKKRMELQQQLTEKDSLVSQLKSEMAALQQSAANSGASQENVASQLTEKIALMEKESKEKDERMNKIKAVAVKARKELDTSRKEVMMGTVVQKKVATLKGDVETLKTERERVTSSMKDIIHGAEGYKNLQMDYDRQTEQLDKEKEKMEAAERQMAELTKRLNTAVTQHEQLWSEREDMLAGMETLRNTVRQLEGQLQELHRHTATQDRDLQGERLLKEQKMKELSSAMKEVEELTTQLRKQKQQSQQTAQELEQLRKEAQQSSLMDMEMADYERLVRELNTKLSERDVCVEELRAQIHTQSQREDTLHQEIESLKSQLDQGEEKSSKMKQLLVKTKKDLADAKKQDASHMMLQASLKGELEAHQQQLEGCKIQVCDLTAERHRLQEQLRSVMEHQQRTTSSLQQRIITLQEECNTAKAELASTGAEFDSYKVRVHNVLKQQKTKSSAQSDGDTSKQERDQVENMVDQLKTKLQDSQQSLQASLAELQQLQTEHDTLLERHNKILQETVTKEADLRERLLSLQAKSMSMRTEHAQTVGQLTSQTEAQRSGFRDQIRHLQEEHRSTVETLQSQIGRLENQLFTLQSQTSSVQIQSSRKPVSDRRPEQGGMGLALSELQSMAREDGEGMETTETESLSPALTPLPSLEQLLTSPDPKHEPFVWQVEPTKEELSQKLTTATRSMEHMNSLLHETEATNAVLMEQITLLKSEVRRLERNHEREKSVANLEYLKNVLLQFIFLQSGSERRALLPVMHTMLQLSPEEKNKLAAIAQGEDEVGAARGSGWTSYLHSWSGIR